MCTYCGCESITIIGRFMDEHVAIINANGELRRAVEAAARHGIERSADLLAGLLFPHTEAEEAGVFTVLARDEDFTEHIEHLCAEHDSLDAQLKRIRAGAHDEMHAFEIALREHINREENGLFPAAAIAFAGPEWDEVDALTPPAAV